MEERSAGGGMDRPGGGSDQEKVERGRCEEGSDGLSTDGGKTDEIGGRPRRIGCCQTQTGEEGTDARRTCCCIHSLSDAYGAETGGDWTETVAEGGRLAS